MSSDGPQVPALALLCVHISYGAEYGKPKAEGSVRRSSVQVMQLLLCQMREK